MGQTIYANKYKTIAIFITLLICHLSHAQVINDHIDKRIELKVNSPTYPSNTTDCTVDWACVDESLTGKCIEYHNDQWFWFKTNQAGNYYININGQQCRDTRGIQLVAIDGVPCQPKTYKILSCISLATQDDIFVELEALQANHSYLLNVDGYLKDFCSFQIQVSTQPQGIPVQPVKEKVIAASKIVDDAVQLEWTLTDDLSDQINAFRILRREAVENRFTEIKVIPHERNVFGKGKLSYTLIDTVRNNGNYFYKIIASVPDRADMLLSETSVNFSSLIKVKPDPSDSITLQLDFKAGTHISIYFYDAKVRKLLIKTNFYFEEKDRKKKYYIGHLKARGVKSVYVRITDQNNKLSQTKFYQF